jgi:hypothetical protein
MHTRAAWKAKAAPGRFGHLVLHRPWQVLLRVVGAGQCARRPASLPSASRGPVRWTCTAWQVLHGERSLYNARGGWDLARFLADADRDDVEAHLANLRCDCDELGEVAAAVLCSGGVLYVMLAEQSCLLIPLLNFGLCIATSRELAG